MRDFVRALGGMAILIGLLYWVRWLTGTWLYWQWVGVIVGLLMVEMGIWKMARQDGLHMPTSPGLRAGLARLETLRQDLETAVAEAETPTTTPSTVEDTRAERQETVEQRVKDALATDNGPDEAHHARV